jgi:hypothetical protein
MAVFSATINYPDAKQVELRDTLAFELNYQENVDDGNGGQIPNPQTKAAFIQEKANEMLKSWAQNTFKSGKDRLALIALNTNLGATI